MKSWCSQHLNTFPVGTQGPFGWPVLRQVGEGLGGASLGQKSWLLKWFPAHQLWTFCHGHPASSDQRQNSPAEMIVCVDTCLGSVCVSMKRQSKHQQAKGTDENPKVFYKRKIFHKSVYFVDEVIFS